MFSTLPKTSFDFLFKFIFDFLSSTNAFNLDQSTISSFGKELIMVQWKTAPPEWLSSERVGLMTSWLWVWSLVEATFLSGVFLPLASADALSEN